MTTERRDAGLLDLGFLLYGGNDLTAAVAAERPSHHMPTVTGERPAFERRKGDRRAGTL